MKNSGISFFVCARFWHVVMPGLLVMLFIFGMILNLTTMSAVAAPRPFCYSPPALKCAVARKVHALGQFMLAAWFVLFICMLLTEVLLRIFQVVERECDHRELP